jgi:hypothetical protein
MAARLDAIVSNRNVDCIPGWILLSRTGPLMPDYIALGE